MHVEVVGEDSLLVHFFPPIRLQDKRSIITKYKSRPLPSLATLSSPPSLSVEWSFSNFDSTTGTVILTNVASKHHFTIGNLEPEQTYSIRISSGNCKGYSEYCYPLVNQSSPSSEYGHSRHTPTDTPTCSVAFDRRQTLQHIGQSGRDRLPLPADRQFAAASAGQ